MTAMPRPWWQENKRPLVTVGVVIIVLLIACALLIYIFGWDWTGFSGGVSKITISSTSKGTTTATELHPAKSLWDWLQLVSSIATTLAIVAAAVWFIWRRASARSLQITLALLGVTMVDKNKNRVAIIRVQLKNNGQTRIRTEQTEDRQQSVSCYFSAKEVEVFGRKPITHLIVRGFDSGRILIFKKLIELEPNEVVSEDVPLALKLTLFEVHVEFHAVGATEGWGATAVFNADEKAQISSTIDLPTEQTTRLGEIVSR